MWFALYECDTCGSAVEVARSDDQIVAEQHCPAFHGRMRFVSRSSLRPKERMAKLLADEREACAALAQDYDGSERDALDVTAYIAAAIRARG